MRLPPPSRLPRNVPKRPDYRTLYKMLCQSDTFEGTGQVRKGKQSQSKKVSTSSTIFQKLRLRRKASNIILTQRRTSHYPPGGPCRESKPTSLQFAATTSQCRAQPAYASSSRLPLSSTLPCFSRLLKLGITDENPHFSSRYTSNTSAPCPCGPKMSCALTSSSPPS